MRLPLSLICAFLCISMTPGWAGQTPQARAAGADLFRDSIPALEMEISADGMNRLRKSPRQYVPATIREGATIYTNVAVHLKGGPGSFRRVDDLPALTLNFDRFADGQTFPLHKCFPRRGHHESDLRDLRENRGRPCGKISRGGSGSNAARRAVGPAFSTTRQQPATAAFPVAGLNVPRDRSRIPEGLANEDRSGQCLRSIQRTCPTVFALTRPSAQARELIGSAISESARRWHRLPPLDTRVSRESGPSPAC